MQLVGRWITAQEYAHKVGLSIARVRKMALPHLPKRKCPEYFDPRDMQVFGKSVQVRYYDSAETGMIYPRVKTKP